MSAPLVVNTTDGTCWTRRGSMRGGEALYAMAGVENCPDLVMATLPELAEHGIAGTADVLPVPVGSPAEVRDEDVTPQVRKLRALLSGQRAVSFFQPGHTYAARVGLPDGRERFRFRCESVTTAPWTGELRALGQHGRRGADGEWVWTPNPRTYDDWCGGAWTDITEELGPDARLGAETGGA